MKEIRIFDFLPPHQLDVLNRNGWVVMLHIPRDGRLGDPVNLAQMVEIEKNWPRVRVIIAHVGRAYCDEDVGHAFEKLSCYEEHGFRFFREYQRPRVRGSPARFRSRKVPFRKRHAHHADEDAAHLRGREVRQRRPPRFVRRRLGDMNMGRRTRLIPTPSRSSCTRSSGQSGGCGEDRPGEERRRVDLLEKRAARPGDLTRDDHSLDLRSDSWSLPCAATRRSGKGSSRTIRSCGSPFPGPLRGRLLRPLRRTNGNGPTSATR